MASLAVPLIEGAAKAMLRALGVVAATGAGAAAINEAAKKKAEAAEKAKTAPIAKAGTQTKIKDACTKCPPDCGILVTRNWNMSEISAAYQARITGFTPTTEWNFRGSDFDGFKSEACMLLEAKAKYDQFFKSSGEPTFFSKFEGFSKIMLQASRQSFIVDNSLPTQLHWHFMQPLSYQYFKEEFQSSGLSILTHLTP